MRMKVALAVCIVAACGLTGRAFSKVHSRRARLAGEILDALRRLEILIVSRLEPLESALVQSGCFLFEDTGKKLGDADDVSDAWRSVCARATVRGEVGDCLSQADLDALNALFERLGESGRESQEEAIRSCTRAFEAAYSEANERAVQCGSLYASIGTLTGLGIAVMIV